MEIKKEVDHVRLSLMRSTFDCFVYGTMSEDSFKEDLKKAKVAFPKAKHYLYAYRIKERDGVVKEGVSENGEPVKAMHKILMELKSQNLFNIGVIIVRHFGGKELGASRLEHTFLEAYRKGYEKFLKEQTDGEK